MIQLTLSIPLGTPWYRAGGGYWGIPLTGALVSLIYLLNVIADCQCGRRRTLAGLELEVSSMLSSQLSLMGVVVSTQHNIIMLCTCDYIEHAHNYTAVVSNHYPCSSSTSIKLITIWPNTKG